VLKLQIGSRIWTDPPVMPTGFTSTGMDGRIGWNVFEGQIVEIDYDQHLLMIRPKLPKSQCANELEIQGYLLEQS
jgi:hypothetical protein